LNYHPAAATDSEERRLASWKALSLHSPLQGDAIWLDGHALSSAQQGRYLANAHAEEALARLKEAGQERHRGRTAGLWILASSQVAGAALGYGVSAATPSHGFLGRDMDLLCGTLLGSLAGTALGAATGATLAGVHFKNADLARGRSLLSFNQKLLHDLDLKAAPLQGGAALGMDGKF